MKKLINSLCLKAILIHLGILLGFVLVSLGFFYPLLQGQKLMQSDTQQYLGMSRQLQENRSTKGEELYWIDNAFGGMPTYQLGAKYPFDVLTPLHKIFRLLPHPAYLLFLYFFGAYLCLLVFGLPKPYAVLGALAYGLSTYLLIIIQVGHNTKAQALGYFPLVFAAIHYLFKNKSLLGIVFAALVMGLQIRANHYQMTYYMLLLLGIYVGYQAWEYHKAGTHRPFLMNLSKVVLAGLLAIALNASSLLATAEYTAFSTRGTSELNQTADGAPKEKQSGLTYDYITQYSVGVFESLNLIIPRIQGGASREDLGTDAPLYADLIQRGASPRQARQFVSNTPTYWGDQPILEAPAYVGVIVFFLAILALFLPAHPMHKWLIIGALLSLVLSWGKNIHFLTQLMIDYFPLYNKFRAVSSAQVILEFCLPVLAMLGLYGFFQANLTEAKRALKKTVFAFLVGFASLYLLSWGLSFSGINDAYYSEVFGGDLMNSIVEARKTIYLDDLLRALIYVLLTTAFLLFFIVGKLRQTTAFIGVALLLLIDLLQISGRYIDRDLFVPSSRLRSTFQQTAADQAILEDTTYFRVYEPALGLQNARTSYFHNAIGGYHGAKPRRFEELIDLFQTRQQESILNILNVKYFILEKEQGRRQVLENPNNLGSAWFITALKPYATADEIYPAMATTEFKDAALIETSSLSIPSQYVRDSLAIIKINKNQPEHKTYDYSSTTDSFVVFSEMYYPNGWKATIDGETVGIFPVNYVLRGLKIPAGDHKIEFQFQPKVVQLGSKIQLFAIVVMLGLLLLGLYFVYTAQLKTKAWE